MSKFNPGDRAITVDGYGPGRGSLVEVVVDDPEGDSISRVGCRVLRKTNESWSGHNLDGRVDTRDGWWFAERMLRLEALPPHEKAVRAYIEGELNRP